MSTWVQRLLIASNVIMLMAVAALVLFVWRDHRGAPPRRGTADPAVAVAEPAAIVDDTAALEQFFAAAHLSGEAEGEIRGRYEVRRQRERELADRMESEGRWDARAMSELRRAFWSYAISKVPTARTTGLPPVVLNAMAH